MKFNIFFTISFMTFIHAGIFCESVYGQNKKDKQLKIADDFLFKGDDLLRTGYYKESIEQFEKALSIHLNISGYENLDVAQLYNSIGIAYSHMGYYQKGIENYEKSLNIRLKILGAESDLVNCIYNNLGAAYRAIGNYQKAISYLEKSITIGLKLSSKANSKSDFEYSISNVADSYVNLGDIYRDIGVYIKSLDNYDNAQSIQLKFLSDNPKNLSTTYNNMGLTYLELGNFQKAIEYFKKSIAIIQVLYGQESPQLAPMFSNLGMAYNELGWATKDTGNYLKAIEYQEKSFEMNFKLNDSLGLASNYSNLGSVYANTNYFSKSIGYFEKALSIKLKILGEENSSVAISYLSLGIVYNKIGNYKIAIEYEEKSLAIFLKYFREHNPIITTCYTVLYRNYLMSNDEVKLKEHLYSYTVSIMEELKSQTNFLDENYLSKYIDSKNFYGRISMMVLSHVFNSPLPTDALISVSIASKGVLWNQSRKLKTEVYDLGDSIVMNSYLTLLSLQQQNNKVCEMTIQYRNKHKINLDSLINVAYEMESSLYLKLGIEQDTSDIKWQEVQSSLKQVDAIVDIVRVQGLYLDSSSIQIFKWDTIQYAVLILTKETPEYPEMVVLPKGAEMEGLWFQNYLSHTSGTNILQTDNSSYEAYWKPIAEKLQGKKNIYFCPDGIYNKLNLNVLFDPTNNSYIADEKDIQLVTNIKEVLKLKQDTAQKFNSKNMNAVVIGNPKFNLSASDTLLFASNTRSFYDDDVSISALDTFTRGLNISQLPGTEQEVNYISSTLKNYGWNVSTYTGPNATEEVIKSLRSPNILHIATHGYFLEDNSSDKNLNGLQLLGQTNSGYHDYPLLRSGLLFSGAQNTFNGNESDNRDNGVLTSQEAMSLFLDSTDLVVLSACETAGGDVKNGEGVYGLQRAFRVAGAHSILMSMWKVDDEATKELMTAFYKNWIENGMNKHDAFKAAQLQLRKIPKYNHPYYWGAFVMVGE